MADISPLLEYEDRQLRNLIRVSFPLNTVYFNIPKAACTTIKRILWQISAPSEGDKKNYRNSYQFDEDIEWGFRYKRDHIKRIERNPYVFTVVRNPYARLYSSFHDKVKTESELGRKNMPIIQKKLIDQKKTTFYDFLQFVVSQNDENRNPHWRSMYYQTIKGKIGFDYIGSVERIDQDIFKIISGIEKLNGFNISKNWILENRNSRKSHEHISSAYGKAEIDLVKQNFAEDFELFGYSKHFDDRNQPPKMIC